MSIDTRVGVSNPLPPREGYGGLGRVLHGNGDPPPPPNPLTEDGDVPPENQGNNSNPIPAHEQTEAVKKKPFQWVVISSIVVAVLLVGWFAVRFTHRILPQGPVNKALTESVPAAAPDSAAYADQIAELFSDHTGKLVDRVVAPTIEATRQMRLELDALRSQNNALQDKVNALNQDVLTLKSQPRPAAIDLEALRKALEKRLLAGKPTS